jgi:hypothetical protein
MIGVPSAIAVPERMRRTMRLRPEAEPASSV